MFAGRYIIIYCHRLLSDHFANSPVQPYLINNKLLHNKLRGTDVAFVTDRLCSGWKLKTELAQFEDICQLWREFGRMG